jgi:glycerol uptake facilitator-like aquaporin
VSPSLSRRLVAETLGATILLATVVGSGIMAASLVSGNQAIALLCNSIATGAILVVLITIFGPTSGAHFNPAVSIAMALRAEMPWSEVASYAIAQIAGAVAGTVLAHLMFELPALQTATTTRWGIGQWIAEFVAAFGLVLAILGCLQHKISATGSIVGLYITAAYWFTASTSFANPAVTIARGLTDTFAGIAPTGVPAFIVAQLAGAAVAVKVARWLWKDPSVR